MEVGDGALRGPVPEDQADLWRSLAGAALPSLRLARAGTCDPADPTTRLGGVPQVADGFDWPATVAGEPLSLVGQLNADEVNATIGEVALPAGTLLAFFYDAGEQRGWGYDPDDAQYWRVVAAPAAHASAAHPPEGAVTLPGLALEPRRVVTVPERWEPPVHELWQRRRHGANRLYDRLDVGDKPPRHRVFGWPDLVQNPMRLECQLASHGIHLCGPDGYQDPRVEELRAGAEDWVLLWQIDTDAEAGWAWGDTGTIYFWIRRQDLAAGDVDRAWLIFQSC